MKIIEGQKQVEYFGMDWDGTLLRRRYALFGDVLAPDTNGLYMTVIRDDDIERAPKWGNFVSWVGAERPAEKRSIKVLTGTIV